MLSLMTDPAADARRGHRVSASPRRRSILTAACAVVATASLALSSSPASASDARSGGRDHGPATSARPAMTSNLPTVPKTAMRANDVTAPVTTPLARGTYTDLHDFGARSDHWARWHTGTDLAAPCGTPVRAATAGMVIVETGAGWSGPWLVKVTTGTGKLTTWYGHMQGLTARGGQIVHAGDQIGYVGAMGNATGCHLHFEVHANGGGMYQDNVDPSLWLAHFADVRPARPAVSAAAPGQVARPSAYPVPQGAVGEGKAPGGSAPIGLQSLLTGGGR